MLVVKNFFCFSLNLLILLFVFINLWLIGNKFDCIFCIIFDSDEGLFVEYLIFNEYLFRVSFLCYL